MSYALEGNITVTGGAVDWLGQFLGLADPATAVADLARTVADSGGVYLVPAFAGLGAPYWDADARGLLCGLTRGTTAAHVARATVESIAYQVRDVFDAMRADAGAPSALLADGGASRNDALMQFQADILGCAVVRNDSADLSALGAAWLAGLAVGVWPSTDALARLPRTVTRFEPRMAEAERDALYSGWRDAVARGAARAAATSSRQSGRPDAGRQESVRWQVDELRLMAKVARLYHGAGLRQTEITERLNIHQSTVSRLLRRAEKEGIVRITLSMPSGLHPELEDALQSAYGLREAIVVDSIDQEDQIVRDLGAAAAFYLETTLKPTDVVGISSWSAALLAMVESMHPSPRAAGARVVQILGGIGNPGAEVHATQLTRRLANMVSGTATLLPAPGAVGSADARRVMLKDRYVQEATALFKSVTVALVGIGAVEPSKLLASSGNVFSAQELKSLSDRGAVGDICLRFFDAAGTPVDHAAQRSRHRHRAAGARARPSRDRHRGREAQDRRHPRRAAGPMDQHADHRPQHGRAAACGASPTRDPIGRRRREPPRRDGGHEHGPIARTAASASSRC